MKDYLDILRKIWKSVVYTLRKSSNKKRQR